MKKICWLFACLLISASVVSAQVEVVSPDLDKALKTSANEPHFSTILFALLFVVFLIYITGVIYSKLNVVGARTVKEHIKRYDLKKAIIISTTQLGQGKNLHVVELNGKNYLIGATPNSISLIKEFEDVSEIKPSFLNEKKQCDENIDDAIQVLYGSDRDDFVESNEIEFEKEEEFSLHKKYL